MEQLEKAQSYQYKIIDLINNNKLLEISNVFNELEKLYLSTKALFQEMEIIKQNTQLQIVQSLNSIRHNIEILENSSATIEDIHKINFDSLNAKELAPGIKINTISIQNETFIPDSPLYYLIDSQEFAIKVANTIIKGNITDKWTPGNFLYTKEPLQKKNMFMRHIGSKNNLITEIKSSTNIEKNNRLYQTAHDLLIYLCINIINKLNT